MCYKSRCMPTPLADLDLMRLHVQLLFRFDDHGALVGTNETPPFSAPRLYLGRTAGGNEWRLHRDLPPEQAHELLALLAAEPPLGEQGAEPLALAAAIVILARYWPVTAIHRGPAFVFESSPVAESAAIRVSAGDTIRFHPELQEMGWVAALNASQEPCFVIEQGGEIVALCHSSRSSPTAAAAGVSTAPAYRRRGYARQVVEAWATEVIGKRRTAFYSTTWENAASRAIARGLGLRYFGEDCSIT